MDDVAFRAMKFARNVHRNQVRKYTNDPYAIHLAEVAGIVATVSDDPIDIAVAWLHDCMEDCDVMYEEIVDEFGEDVAYGVFMLSDLEKGNRAERKKLSRKRLSEAMPWVQTIKYADLISNTPSIVKHDPKFATTYLEEINQFMDVVDKGDRELFEMLRNMWYREIMNRIK